jgi:L-ascorbate metabolism protein UlaG (beta-lactamase superfamily)
MPSNHRNSRPRFNPALPFVKANWQGNPLSLQNTYLNLDGASERSFAELLRWQRQKNPLKPFKKNQQSPLAVISNKDFTVNKTDGITWLGHASFWITIAGLHVVTDPVLGNVGPVKRMTALPCSAADLCNIDVILLSHNHRDHCDKKSMQLICKQNPAATVITGLGIGALLKKWNIANRIVECGWYQSFQPDAALQVTYLPAKHWNRRGLLDMNEMLWGSFMLETNNSRIYFGADSGLGIHFEEIGRMFPGVDVAMLGIGAYQPEWFMHTAHTSPAGALQAFEQLGAARLLPMHHGTFDLSDEPIFWPLQEIKKLAASSQISHQLLLPNLGEKMRW